MPVSISKFSVAFASLIAASNAWAADNELYDAPPPEDAAFIRWIGDAQSSSAFGVPAQDVVDATFHPVSAEQTDGARAGAFYTVAIDAAGQPITIEEPDREDRSKVYLILLNLASAPASLIVSGTDMTVVDFSDAGTADARPVNPVSADLEVVSADGTSLGVFSVALRRGQNLTFVARDVGAELIENQFGPNIER